MFKYSSLALAFCLLSTELSSFARSEKAVVAGKSFKPVADEHALRHRVLKGDMGGKTPEPMAQKTPEQLVSATINTAPKKKIKKSPVSVNHAGKSMKSKPPEPDFIDQVCIDFCNDYFFKYCSTSNIYVNPTSKNRRLVTTQEADLDRGSTDLSSGIEQCQRTCMSFPRGVDPATYDMELFEASDAGAHVFNSNLGGDTIWCRKRHMSIINYTPNQQQHSAFHCSHAANPSMGICRDSLVNGYTPYELLRNGQPSRHHYGYCDIAGEGTIAECTNQLHINDGNLANVLAMMPDTVEVIFLNGIPGITTLTANIFSDNLANSEIVQAIYLNDCALATIEPRALAGLPELKIFNADSNADFTTLDEDMFINNPKLLQWSMFNTGITSIPAGFFQHTLDIERIVGYGTPLTEFEAGVFDNLTKLQMLSFVNCQLSNDGIPDDVFNDLESLQFFDLFADPAGTNEIAHFKKEWFNYNGGASKMGANLIRIAMWGNPVTTVDHEAFENLHSLEVAYFHNTPVEFLPYSLFAGKPYFTHLTLSEMEEQG